MEMYAISVCCCNLISVNWCIITKYQLVELCFVMITVLGIICIFSYFCKMPDRSIIFGMGNFVVLHCFVICCFLCFYISISIVSIYLWAKKCIDFVIFKDTHNVWIISVEDKCNLALIELLLLFCFTMEHYMFIKIGLNI